MHPTLPRLACLAALIWTGLAFAQQNSNPPPKPPENNGAPPEHRGPPPEAVAACKSLAAGATCSFTSPRGAETGTCFAPEGKPLACRPKHGPGGPGGQDGAANGGGTRPKPAN